MEIVKEEIVMLGAIIGDYVGSPYEFDCNNIKTEEFPFFGKRCSFTDDSVLTIAVAEALMHAIENDGDICEECVTSMQAWGRTYPNAGYGGRFISWLWSESPQPYNSWGNGSAMRVSAVGWLFDTLEDTERAAELTASVSHNHEEGIRGAQATAVAIFLARKGATKLQIKEIIEQRYGYDLNRTLAEIRPRYHHVESCQETVPVSIIAFLESRGFEDALRKAVSVGGDSDTLACITGGIAEAYYTIPQEIRRFIMGELPKDLAKAVKRWRKQLHKLQKKAPQWALGQEVAEANQQQALKLWNAGLFYKANRALRGEDPDPPKTLVATASDWDTKPMPETTTSFSLNMHLSAEEFHTLAMGHVPGEMEDKWFSYFEPNDQSIRFYRSWTGHCIFIAYIEENNGDYVVKDVVANQDSQQYSNDDVESMAALVSALIAQDIGRDPSAYWDNI